MLQQPVVQGVVGGAQASGDEHPADPVHRVAAAEQMGVGVERAGDRGID